MNVEVNFSRSFVSAYDWRFNCTSLYAIVGCLSPSEWSVSRKAYTVSFVSPEEYYMFYLSQQSFLYYLLTTKLDRICNLCMNQHKLAIRSVYFKYVKFSYIAILNNFMRYNTMKENWNNWVYIFEFICCLKLSGFFKIIDYINFISLSLSVFDCTKWLLKYFFMLCLLFDILLEIFCSHLWILLRMHFIKWVFMLLIHIYICQRDNNIFFYLLLYFTIVWVLKLVNLFVTTHLLSSFELCFL